MSEINKNPDNYNNVTSIKLEEYPNIMNFLSMATNSEDVNINKAKLELQEIIAFLKKQLPYTIYSKLLKETNNFSDNQKTLYLINNLCKKENLNLNDNFKEFVKLLNLNSDNQLFNPVKLVQEERQLTEQIRMALSYNKEEYDITYLSDFKKYFEDYLAYKLTEIDWQYFKKGFAKFQQLYNKYAKVNRIKEIEQDFKELNKYYEINDRRSEIFANNLLRNENPQTIEKQGIRGNDEILKDSRKVIVAVTGGFHSEALEYILSKKQVNIITITPSVHSKTDQANKKYNEIILEQSKIYSQALAYTLISCTKDTEKQQQCKI